MPATKAARVHARPVDAPNREHAAARLRARARGIRDEAWGRTITFSPKVFLPLTNLCRNRCDYCAFRRDPGQPGAWTMSPDDVDETLLLGRDRRCTEALFCIGDTPETFSRAYVRLLAGWGYASTVAHLVASGTRALGFGLLPHTNAGILDAEAMARLRRVNVSLGLMLETVSERLCRPGMPHRRAPDKRPARRLAMIEEAGRLRIPFTTGVLVGIGETLDELEESLHAIADLHRQHGHIQEVIVQGFRREPGTPMAAAPEPTLTEIADAVALARVVLPIEISVQAPPNLTPEGIELLLDAGVNDLGGISPATPDFVNPVFPWPDLEPLRRRIASAGFELRPRLPIYRRYLDDAGWLDPALRPHVERARASFGGAPAVAAVEHAR